MHLLYQHNKITTKSLQQFNQVIIIMKENMIVIRGNESLAENKIKNETEQLLFTYKDGNNIYEHGKQKNK